MNQNFNKSVDSEDMLGGICLPKSIKDCLH